MSIFMSKCRIQSLSQFCWCFVAVMVLSVSPASTVSAGMELHELDGEVVDLDDYVGNGKWLLVMFWATTCPICEAQKPSISEFHSAHKDKDAHVLGIAIDGMSNIDAIKNNVATHVTSFPSLVGDLVIIASHYQGMTEESFLGTPTYLLFNPEGELLANNPGPLRTEAIEQFIARNSS